MTAIDNRPRLPTTMSQFFIIWGGQAVSHLGTNLVQFALIWYLTKETGSATMLALASLMGLLPQVVLGPIVGALIDRWNRRRVMVVADAAIALASLGLAVDFWLGTVQPWHILVLMLLRSIGEGFHFPAMRASTSLMVPEDQLSRIAGLNQALQGGINVIAAPLGALLLAVMSVGGILMIDIVTALFAITPLLFIPVPQPERAPESMSFTLFDDLKEGFVYVWNWKGLLYLMAMATVLNFLLVPSFSLMSILVSDTFNGEAAQYALVMSLFSVGAIVGGIGLGIWGGFKKRIWTSWLGVTGLAIAILVMGLIPAAWFPAAVVASFVIGLTISLTNAPVQAIMQSVVEPDKQGRVFTLASSLSAGAAPLSLLIAGPVADAIGVQSMYVISGIGTLLLSLSILVFAEVRNIEDHGRAALEEEMMESSDEEMVSNPALSK